jgi:hypothetical protein
VSKTTPVNAHINAKESFKEMELAVKTAKEIVIKFIEVDKLSPTSFPEVFNNIFQTVLTAVKANTDRPSV